MCRTEVERPRAGGPGRRALARIRCGHHELRICTGAWDGLDEEDRWCPVCAEAVETEEHFLLDCTARKDERAALYDAIDAMVAAARAAKGDRNGATAATRRAVVPANRWNGEERRQRGAKATGDGESSGEQRTVDAGTQGSVGTSRQS